MSEDKPKAEPAPIRTTGVPVLMYTCEAEAGGCGMLGYVQGIQAVKHWTRGGIGQVTCRCGAVIVIGKKEVPRIITPQQHAQSVAAAIKR